MKTIDIILILIFFAVITALAMKVFMWLNKSHKEGFEASNETKETAQDAVNNVLLRAVEQMKTVSAHILNPKNWSERLELATLSPVELARRYIISQDKNRVNASS
jgi:hypothetical protein